MAVLERKECTRCGRDWNLPPNSGGCACEFLLPHEATVVRYVPEAEVERLRAALREAAGALAVASDDLDATGAQAAAAEAHTAATAAEHAAHDTSHERS